MARVKTPALILSFAKTTDAMAVEKHCMDKGLPGRLIPVPRQITAGCGLSWKAAPEDQDVLTKALTEVGLVWSGLYILEL